MTNNVVEVVARFKDELSGPLTRAKTQVQGFGTQVAASLSPLAALVTAFATATAAGFKMADAIGDAADRAGVAVETLSRLKYAAEQNDVEFSALTLAVKRWQVTLSQAASGSKDAASAIGLLQLNAAQLKNLRLEDQLAAISDQFKRIRDPADQTRIAVELFGRSGEQLVPLLRQGGAAISQLTSEADRLGITLSGPTARSIDAADKALKKLKATLATIGTQAAGNIALAITGPQGDLDAAAIKVQKLLAQRQMLLDSKPASDYFKNINAKALASVDAQIKAAREVFDGIEKAQNEAANANPLVIPAEVSPISEVNIKAAKRQIEGVTKLLQDFEEQTRTVTESARSTLEQTKLKLQELFAAGGISAKQYSDRLQEAIARFNDAIDIEPVKVSVQKVAIAQQVQINEFVKTVKEGLANLAQSGELTGKSVAKYLLAAFESKLIYKAIENIGAALSKALSNASGKSGAAGAIGSAIGAVFGHAAGGGSGSGPRVVGEDGPEVLFDSGRVMNRRQLAFAMGGGGGGVTVHQGDVNVSTNATDPAAVAQMVYGVVQQNNKRLLESLNRRFKNNGLGNLR